jgi:curved DNA-binding protein CbpA
MHAYRPTHYEALGVARSADAEAIRTAWRAKAKQVRPDLS